MNNRLLPCYRIAPNRVWRTYLGGRTLDEISHAEAPADSHFPEDWLLSSTLARNIGREEFADEGISQVETADGTVKFTTLAEQFPRELFGEAHCREFGTSAGFLLKYLDSSIRLHIQCHPSIPFAQQHLNSNSGKTEGYYILGVRPECEGYLYLGFQRQPDPEKFKNAVAAQDIPEILSFFDRIPVKPGDCFLVPGGVPHAIGEGVFMVEMMEPTDFAVRIEFERGGYVLPESSRFMGRGIDFAMSMFDFSARNIDETRQAFFITPQELPISGEGKRFSLLDERKTRCFRLEKLSIRGQAAIIHRSLRVFIVLSGSGTLRCGTTALQLQQFDRVLVPYATEKVELDGEMELLIAMPPAQE